MTHKGKPFALASLLLMALSAYADTEPPLPLSDIKPTLDSDGFDEEQMRLASVIHKRIVDYQQIKNKTNDNQPQPFASYKETLKTGVQFDLRSIKGGTFSWKGEQAGDALEVTLSPFWMSAREVSWEEYEPFMLSEIPRQKNGMVLDFMREHIKNDIDLIARPTPPYHPMTYGMKRDGHPAISMTQHAANKYCQWLSYQTGHFYRLPTEAEWEYASKAGSKTKYSWGNDSHNANDYAWFGGDNASHYQPSGLKKPNAWGLYDMHGNVAEWTLDQYVPNRKSYFGKDRVLNPWVRATKPYPHVVKGGYWKQTIENISSSTRLQSTPQWKIIDPQIPKSLWYHTCTPWLGFRIVRSVEIPTALEMYHYWNSGVEHDE